MERSISTLLQPRRCFPFSHRAGPEAVITHSTQNELIPDLPEEIARECLLPASPKCHSNVQAVCRKWPGFVKSPEFYKERRRAGYCESYVGLVQALPEAEQSSKPVVYGLTVYDAKLLSWNRLPRIPSSPEGIPLFCHCLTVGKNLVLLGGWSPITWEAMKCVYIFNFCTWEWRKGADMLETRSFFACAAMGDTVMVAGGHDDSKHALNSAEVYDFKLDRWQSLPRMNQERDECKATAIGGKFFVISGYTTETQGQFGSSADVFDPSTGYWNLVDDMWPSGLCPSVILSVHGQLFAFRRHELLCYNVSENVWKFFDSIPEPLWTAPCATVVRDQIFVTASACVDGCRSYQAYLYHPKQRANARGEWVEVGRDEKFSGMVQAACAVEV